MLLGEAFRASLCSSLCLFRSGAGSLLRGAVRSGSGQMTNSQPTLNQRYGPECRVKRRGDFVRIQNVGEKFRSRFFLVAVVPASSRRDASAAQAGCRLGITITTKIDKRSSRRNRLRRRLRELFRKNFRQFPRAVDAVVIAHNGSTELSFEEVEREVCYLARKIRRALCSGEPGHSSRDCRGGKPV